MIDTALSGSDLAIGSNNMNLSSTSSDIIINFKNLIGDGAQSNSIYGANTVIRADKIYGNQYGDQITLGNVSKGAIKSLNVATSWTVCRGGAGNATFYVTGVENHSVDNVDTSINVMTASMNLARTMLAYGTTDSTSLVNENSFVSVNSMISRAGFWVAGSTASIGKLTVVFTNNAAANSLCEGNLFEGYMATKAFTP